MDSRSIDLPLRWKCAGCGDVWSIQTMQPIDPDSRRFSFTGEAPYTPATWIRLRKG